MRDATARDPVAAHTELVLRAVYGVLVIVVAYQLPRYKQHVSHPVDGILFLECENGKYNQLYPKGKGPHVKVRHLSSECLDGLGRYHNEQVREYVKRVQTGFQVECRSENEGYQVVTRRQRGQREMGQRGGGGHRR